jgi:hypothetical protein
MAVGFRGIENGKFNFCLTKLFFGGKFLTD